MVQNKSVIFNEIPHGEPKLDQTLKVKSDEFDTQQDIADGSVMLKVITLSIDPYQRGRMRAPDSESYVPPFYVGQPIQNHGVARVLKSKNAAFKEGALVYGGLPFSEYMVLNEQFAQGLKDVSDSGIAPETLVGACGMPGRTAYMSFYHVGQPKAGQSIYVSAGAGAVGALVIQYAKKTGLKVIASAGSAEKVELCRQVGADAAFNYKESSTKEEIKKFGGIDIFYDNVGGKMLDDVLEVINPDGLVIMCGAISQYNSAGEMYGLKNTVQLVFKRLTTKGFIVFYLHDKPSSHPDFSGKTLDDEFTAIVPKLVKEGSIKIKEHVYNGIEKAPEAFIDMLSGKNVGKVVVKLELIAAVVALKMGRASKIISAGSLEFTTTCTTSSYPKEGAKVKSKSQHSSVQGASTVLNALSSLPNTECYMYSQLGRDLTSNCVKAQLAEEGISTEYIYKSDSAAIPHTFVINNTSNNTKTRLNHSSGAGSSSLPPLEYFDRVLQQFNFDWIHFDGQTTTNLYETIKHLRKGKGEGVDDMGLPRYKNTLISISCFNKLKPDMVDCLPFADFVFFNKEFVNKSGFDDARTFLLFMSLRVSPRATIYCIWDERTSFMLSLKSSEYIKSENTRRPLAPSSRSKSYSNSNYIDEAFVAGAIYATLARATSINGNFNGKLDNQKVLQFATDMMGLKGAGVPLQDIGGILIREGWFTDISGGVQSLERTKSTESS
ncbi:Zinc-type alcohol dehydrogenase-like protein PB24D3.08c [Wallemia ichthyophaga EXF-994]|uniref:Zinc-type alcohol dehydrogenase-like protein PB24D3.08c n=1 Tax=Wallemia ichthyophaga (strain EXF-994 / CBS 113033) TaxID=1299270 RepID=R9AGZ0_WALI9|nr:Zinc-type alcohol dehydrogenase-like protein PB24D3.08c [Wallemia ichthyophaga EXF-994]EOQ99290.1 Zinc-type alcohol dehydrogenase-like protein PB24D3.08c [Wallemia ichthyophaga EXF-994]TIB32320.1 hypothetical protein E3P84_02616 [Wallemia ichthyophaga]TIB40928.1 hypothetical protein E3P83_02504 [Wallemia ichthyophaga]